MPCSKEIATCSSVSPEAPRVQTPIIATVSSSSEVSKANPVSHSIPSFSFTGNLASVAKHVSPSSQKDSISENYVLAPDTQQTAESIKNYWKILLDQLQKKGRIRISAALSNSQFSGNKVIVTVANKAIEQEISDIRINLLDLVYSKTALRVQMQINVTEDEVFIAKPVSDSQRLTAMIERHGAIRDLCNELKLRL